MASQTERAPVWFVSSRYGIVGLSSAHKDKMFDTDDPRNKRCTFANISFNNVPVSMRLAKGYYARPRFYPRHYQHVAVFLVLPTVQVLRENIGSSNKPTH